MYAPLQKQAVNSDPMKWFDPPKNAIAPLERMVPCPTCGTRFEEQEGTFNTLKTMTLDEKFDRMRRHEDRLRIRRRMVRAV